MQITEAILHRMIKAEKTSGEGCVETVVRPESLAVDETLNTVVSDLISLYAKSSDSQGTFGENENIHIFPRRFNEYVRGDIAFSDIASAGLSLIADEMKDSYFATGGYALFVRYSYQGQDFFLIAVLKLRPGAGIDEKTLALEPNLSIDLDKLNEAARINIDRLNDGVQPYLTFIKGKRKKSQITDYFRNALSCTSFTSSAHHTKQLMQAADAYMEQRDDFENEQEKKSEKILMKQRLYNCFKENPDEITLQTAAAYIHPNNSEEVVSFIKGNGEQAVFDIDDAFKPDKKTYYKLQRISGTMGNVRVSFSVSDVQDGTVSYDAEKDVIILRRPSQGLRQEILDNESPT